MDRINILNKLEKEIPKLRTRWLIRNIFRVALPMLSPILILGVLAFAVIQGELNTEIRENNTQIMRQTNRAIESVFGTIEQIGAVFDSNLKNQYMLKSVLNKQSATYLNKDDYESVLFLTDLIKSYLHANPYIHSVYLYMQNPYANVVSSRNAVLNDPDTQKAAWTDAYQKMQIDQTHLIGSRFIEDYPYESGTVDCITISRKIQSITSNNAGIITINFRKNMIQNMIRNHISVQGSAIFMVESGEIIASASQISNLQLQKISPEEMPRSGVSEWDYQGTRYVCFSDISKVYGFELISIIPKDGFYQSSRNILYITIVLLLLSMIIGSTISYYIAHKNYESIFNVLGIIKAAEKNEPLPVYLDLPKNEYEYLLQNLINTYIKRSAMRTQNVEEKYMMKKMEMLVLEAQINPHFLHNTLRTMFWRAVQLTKAPNDVSKMIEYLSDLLSFTFTVQGFYVPLKQEIAYTNSYLNIQRIRFSGRFEVIWKLDKAIESAQVMKLVMQPVLENSLLHGFNADAQKKHAIKITIVKKESILCITITDNGVGMSKQRLSEVREKLNSDTNGKEHIGLSNVKKRLEVLYKGESTQLEVFSKLSLGTCVRIVIPYVEGDE